VTLGLVYLLEEGLNNMACYLHECPNDECPVTVFEDRRAMSEIDNPINCPQCQTLSPRTMHRTSFQLKGQGWYRDSYGTSDSRGRPIGQTVKASSLASSTASKTHKK